MTPQPLLYGARLRAAREGAGISQQALAAAANVSRATVQNLEYRSDLTGRARTRSARAVTEALHKLTSATTVSTLAPRVRSLEAQVTTLIAQRSGDVPQQVVA
jgi:transcriptional regulator with XRE-family HTH domain